MKLKGNTRTFLSCTVQLAMENCYKVSLKPRFIWDLAKTWPFKWIMETSTFMLLRFFKISTILQTSERI